MTDKEDKTVRQFVLFCRAALMYEQKDYYTERKHRAERETHIEALSLKQSGMIGEIFDTYHADYFSVMGYEIGIVDGELAQALRGLSDKYIQIVLLYYVVGLNDREIEFSLSCELGADERLKAAKKLAEFFRDKGMAVDMNLHNPDHENPNPHCHLMLTMRPFQKVGTFLEKKCWREYELDKNGQKIPTKKGNDYKSHKVYATDWDDKGNVEKGTR